MFDFLIFLGLLGLGVWVLSLQGEIKDLQRRVVTLEDADADRLPASTRTTAEPAHEFKVAAKATPRRRATIVTSDDFVLPPPTSDYQPPETEPEPEPARRFTNPLAGASFEDLVGGKLPIWIGGIALVFAGFFLVRYTIEAGLLGPGARSIGATLFALLIIALSEFGGKLPKLGDAFTADPRVGQSLAGAGVATLYGTLYMASEIYGLVGVGTAFLLVIIVTVIAFALSLRQGPPTALMGMVGGFAAPWVAGMGADNLPTLLLYLATFIAALFGLAIWRRWLWLLVLASGGGAVWSFAMLVSAESGLAWLGLFTLVTAAAAVFALDRFKEAYSRWTELAAYAPMALALVQLTLLLPRMEFSIVGWAFFGALSVLAIWMAWREAKMALAMLAALLLSLAPLAETWSQNGGDVTTVVATFGLVLLFGGAGHFAIRQQRTPIFAWAIAALATPVLAWFAGSMPGSIAYPDHVWGMAALIIAAVSGWTAWEEHRLARTGIVQRLASAATVLMLLMAGLLLLAEGWMPVWCAIVALGIAAWARVTQDRVVRGITLAPLGLSIIWVVGASWSLVEALVSALWGDVRAYAMLPPIADAVRDTLLPVLLILGLLWDRAFLVGDKTRAVALAVGGAGLAAFLWMLAKQPAAIQSPSDFIRVGFAERTVITQILFGLSWLALAQSAKREQWRVLAPVGWVLVVAALFRLVWFDLILLNPVTRPQMVGPVPVANLATGHFAAVALWLWLLGAHAGEARRQLLVHIASLCAMILAVLATVRQLMQGNILSGGTMGTGENYLYSVGLLALAIVWLVRGMMAESRLLRLAGLVLLTAVTFKVFLVDAAALEGVLRILSFLGLGIALIGIGWAYGRVMGTSKTKVEN